MRVRDVMTTRVVSVEPKTSVGEAAGLMLAHRISGLPVVSADGTLVGIVSEGDFLRRSELGTGRKRPRWLAFLMSSGRMADEYVHLHGRTVDEVMSTDVATTSQDAPLDEVVDLMGRRRIKRVPVTEDGKIVGIVARSDLLRALARALPANQAEAADDERILAALSAELDRQEWSGNGLIRARVTDGAVELLGTIFDERQRLAARVAAENIPGVKSVSDQLVWIEPRTGTVILPSSAPVDDGVA